MDGGRGGIQMYFKKVDTHKNCPWSRKLPKTGVPRSTWTTDTRRDSFKETSLNQRLTDTGIKHGTCYSGIKRWCHWQSCWLDIPTDYYLLSCTSSQTTLFFYNLHSDQKNGCATLSKNKTLKYKSRECTTLNLQQLFQNKGPSRATYSYWLSGAVRCREEDT